MWNCLVNSKYLYNPVSDLVENILEVNRQTHNESLNQIGAKNAPPS
jgi:hypothetical protein